MSRLNKTIEYLAYLFAFVLPIQTRWIIKAGSLGGEYFENGTISLYGSDIVVIVLLCLLAWLAARKRMFDFRFSIFDLKRKKTWAFIFLFILCSLISIFFAPNRLVALYSFIRLLLGIGLFWAIVTTVSDKVKMIWSFVAGATIQAGLGIWQFLTQSTFANKWLGLAVHDPLVRGVSIVETADGHRWLRAYGGLDHPNLLGGFLVVAIILLAYIFIRNNTACSVIPAETGTGIQGKARNFWIPACAGIANKTLAMNFLLLTSYFLLLAALFFTFSRAAWIALIFGLAVILVGSIIKKSLATQKELLKLILMGGVVAFVLFNLYGNLVMTRVSENSRLEIKSTEERMSSYRDFFQLIRPHWLTGVGIGNYGQAMSSVIPEQSVWYYQPVHDTFLLVWGETGILGLSGFLGLLGYLGWSFVNRFFRISNIEYRISDDESTSKTEQLIGIAILITVIMLSLVDHWLWSLHFGVLLFWFGIGLAENLQKRHIGVK